MARTELYALNQQLSRFLDSWVESLAVAIASVAELLVIV